MNKHTEFTAYARLRGSLVHDPDTGPDEIEDVALESLFLFGQEWSLSGVKSEFGNLAAWIVNADNGEDWT